jgi:asparagine synthase (glutamine-hydrolysing)
MGDVEVASYLSSGIDSSTVSTLATRHKSRPLSTYTASFGLRGWYDETPGAFTLANQLGSQHNIVEITTHSLKREMDDLIFSLDEPRMGTGSFSQYMLAKAAAEKFKVILTGHGGDELFAGYPIFKLMQLLQEFKIGSPVNRQGLCSLRYSELPHLVYFLLRRLRSDGAAAYLPVLFSDTLLSRGLLPEVYEQIKSINPEDDLRQLVGNEADPYHQLTLVYLRAYLPGLFVVEDKISMAHSLESRTPLCDNELVDFSLSLPLSLKLDGGQLKAIPKAAMRNYLPEILYRLPKRGFPTPLAYWLRGELRDWTRQRLLCEDSPLHRIFKMSFLQHLVSSYLGSWRKHIRPLDEIQTHRIWALLSLDSWLRVTENRLGVSLEMN